MKAIFKGLSPVFRSADDDEDEGGRRDRGCGAQYQSTTLRVLTHFEAESGEGLGQPDFLLGSDWQVDVTELVKDLLKVEDSRVAKITDGATLAGLNAGTTKVQVRHYNALFTFILFFFTQ